MLSHTARCRFLGYAQECGVPVVALLGGECTGKTSLALDLAAQLDAVVVAEYVRAFVDEHGRSPEAAEQAAVFAAQEAAIRGASRERPHAWIICDPAAAMTAIYSEIYFDDRSLHQSALDELGRAELVLWCDIDVPWVPDGAQRDGPHMRRAAHAAIERMMVSAPDIPIIRVSGSPSNRRHQALEALGSGV